MPVYPGAHNERRPHRALHLLPPNGRDPPPQKATLVHAAICSSWAVVDSPRPRDGSLTEVSRTLGQVARAASVLAAGGFLTVLVAGSGGYFPSDWGLVLLAFTLLGAAAILLRDRVELGRLDLCFVGGLTLFAAWTFLSATWAQAVGPAFYDGELALLYAVGAAAVLVALPTRTAEVPVLAVLVAAAAVSLYALGTHLFPGDLGGAYNPGAAQLDGPIGYANATGIIAVLGLLLAGGVALHGRHAERAIAAATLVPLAATTLFSSSRGSLVALAVATPLLVLCEPARGRAAAQLAVLGAPALVGAVLAIRSSALLEAGTPLDDAARAGHRLAGALALLALLNAGLALALDRRSGI